MVTLDMKGSERFFSRNSAGKYPLDITEIRSAVLATESQADRIRRFREERIGRIIADETPVTPSFPGRLVLHMIPITSFLNRERLDIKKGRPSVLFQPINAYGGENRYNLDGYLTWGLGGRYCQLFFDGTVETVFTGLIHPYQLGQKNVNLIASVAYERHVIEAVRSYLAGYLELGLTGPVAISMAILGCRGAYMGIASFGLWGNEHPIDRDIVILPDVVTEELEKVTDVAKVMKPLFDAAWNACGYPYSQNYDTDGNWVPKG